MPYRKCFCWLGLTRLACLQLAFFLLVLTAVKPLSVTAGEKVRKAPVRPEVLVGVSPAGNLEDLRSDSKHFVDIDSWLRDPGYVDYLVPQIYWGFERKNPDGSPSSEAFKSCLKAWMGLERSDRMALLVGLALYKAGLGDEDNNPVSEWLVRDDIIARQIKLVSKQKSLAGFALFDYSDLHRPEAAGELNYMKDLLK